MHRSLPELALDEIDLTTAIAGVELPAPVIINAMTGGAPGVEAVNRDLAVVAAELGLAMAVGSQTAGLAEPAVASTYQVVRKENPRGVVIANLSADATVEKAERAVAMIEANLLQIHLNAPQELVMREGDRDFRGHLRNIERLVRSLPVPVVVKECGFGMSSETVRSLYAVGVRAVDLSGRGGTNFAWIEARRRQQTLDPGLEEWGIPAAASLGEVASLGYQDLDIIASGGVMYGSHAAKALALGARAVGVAGAVLSRYYNGGVPVVREYLAGMVEDVRRTALLAGAGSVGALRTKPVVVMGATGEWLRLRGVDLAALARR